MRSLPSGPWNDEHNSAEWHYLGLLLTIKRHEELGHLCGYVHIPMGNRYHGADSYEAYGNLEVHGGITFSQKANIGPDWVLGFDCAHHLDMVPGLGRDMGTYRDFQYVQKETESLARQILDLQA